MLYLSKLTFSKLFFLFININLADSRPHFDTGSTRRYMQFRLDCTLLSSSLQESIII